MATATSAEILPVRPGPAFEGFLELPQGTLDAGDRVVVRGVNMIKKHQRQTPGQDGGIISREASLHVSNVAVKDPSTGKATRVGFKITDGKKVRVAKASGEVIDG